MSYCTLTDLTDRYGETELIQLTDEAGTGAIDTVRVARAIADADAEIDAWLARRVALPLATVPGALVRMAAAMVRYYLYKDAAPDLVTDQYEAAVKFLQAVAHGTVSLGPDPAFGSTPDSGAPSFVQGATVFAAGLEGY